MHVSHVSSGITHVLPVALAKSQFKAKHGLIKKEAWHNNNSTQHQNAYLKDLRDLKGEPARIIGELFALNHMNKQQNFIAVPVAGWEAAETHIACELTSHAVQNKRLVHEYAQSFSLSDFSTAKNASLILRTSKEAQKMKIIHKGDQSYLKVSAGVRVTDADDFLWKQGYALPPNMTTIHTVSLAGAAANGCYGPARDYASMTSDIVKMKIINALGEKMTLSSKSHPELFEALRDAHLGTCFVRNLTFKIEPKFYMERKNRLFKDVEALSRRMKHKNFLDEEHFIAMYIPVDIHEQENNPRIRITTFNRTDKQPQNTSDKKDRETNDYWNLQQTEAGEPLIDVITKSEKLRKFFPFLLKQVALKTYGTEKKTTEVDWSAPIAHIFGTYTDLPIRDINWLIQVKDAQDAKELLLDLLGNVEEKLKVLAQDKHYPILNAFGRYLKGLCYPEGKGGIAPTAVDEKGQMILSFELVTYEPLAKTEAFQALVDIVLECLKDRIYNYHPGKHMPDTIRSLPQIYGDNAIRLQRLENFKQALYTLHGGEENVEFSPFLTPQKKAFLGLGSYEHSEKHETVLKLVEECHEKEALQLMLEMAKSDELHHESTIEKITACLKKHFS